MTNEQAHSTCPIDWDDLFNRIGDEEIIVEFSLSFVKNGEKIIDSLKEAVASADPEQIELYAHALKGSASNIGAIPLAKISWQLEKAASEKQIAEADQWVAKIEAEFGAVNTFLGYPDWTERAKQFAAAKS